MNDKELGVVLTPPKTADYIISRLGKVAKYEKVCDLCVGPGVFIRSLLKTGVNSNQIFTFDVNPAYKSKIEGLCVSFKEQDSLLSLTPDSHDAYDYIVGNPPYLNKASSYVREHRIDLKKIYGKINAHETYSMFMVNGVWRLKEGGKLGFITSDSFLTLRTHAKLRRFLLDNCLINEILLAPSNLFDDQNVSTSPAIIILTKCSGKQNEGKRKSNVMKIIPRVRSEDEYLNPPLIHEIKQEKYELLPFNLFFTDVEEQVIEMFDKSSKLENHVKGYIGMHTHDNLKYIAAVEGTELAEIFTKRNEKIQDNDKKHRIIVERNLDSDKWKSYLKRGGGAQYYRPIMEALDWRAESIPVYDIPKNVPFEEEGIVISGVSSRLAARYMPKGCYWDSNKAIGFIIENKNLSIEYVLGILNSSLYNYLAKGIINNTSSIQITGIHALPFITPELEIKKEVEQLVKSIIKNKKKYLNYDYNEEQKKIDEIVFNFHAKHFNFPLKLKKKLDRQFSCY